jgi:hypothetical protein
MTNFLRIRAARRRLIAMAWPLALALSGCAGDPLPASLGPDPADATQRTAAGAYIPVTAGTLDHQPVEPKGWREMNDRVAPRTGRTP